MKVMFLLLYYEKQAVAGGSWTCTASSRKKATFALSANVIRGRRKEKGGKETQKPFLFNLSSFLYSFGRYFSQIGSICGMTPKAEENINLGA